jgi:hypothetical protein
MTGRARNPTSARCGIDAAFPVGVAGAHCSLGAQPGARFGAWFASEVLWDVRGTAPAVVTPGLSEATERPSTTLSSAPSHQAVRVTIGSDLRQR